MAAGRFHLWRPKSRLRLVAAMAVYSGLALAPDLDVIGFWLGVPYSAPFGHRGAAHSLAVALAIGLVTAFFGRLAGTGALKSGSLATLAVATHGPLDTITSGGLGIALLWPFTNRRYLASWRPIPAASMGYNFFSRRGLGIVGLELLYFSPLYLFALWPR